MFESLDASQMRGLGLTTTLNPKQTLTQTLTINTKTLTLIFTLFFLINANLNHSQKEEEVFESLDASQMRGLGEHVVYDITTPVTVKVTLNLTLNLTLTSPQAKVSAMASI